MKIERTQNAKRNILYGLFLKVYQILIPFFMRTIMIYLLGIQYAGLNNLFSSIFQFLNLAELGIGAALTSSMYEPIATDDTEKICKLLNLYRRCFNIIGVIIFLLGMLVFPFLKYLIKGTVPGDLNIYILFILYLFNTVLSYWLFSYKKSLVYAFQRTDIVSKIMIFTYTFQYIGQSIVLFVFKNYYAYLIISIISQILNNLLSNYIVNKIYPIYKPRGLLDKKTLKNIKEKVYGLITNKIGGVILRSSDSIVISSFLGLTELAIYQNYYFILSAIINLIAVFFEACLAGIGNSLIIEGKEKNFKDFKVMTFITFWVVTICSCCLLSLYQPFMEIWVGKKYVMDYSLVICLVIYFMFYEIDALLGTFKDAAGIWFKDRFRPLITALCNLGLSIFLVNYMGLFGVLLATILSMVLIGIPWLIQNTFQSLFNKEYKKEYIIYICKLTLIGIAISILCILLTEWIHVNIYISLFLKGIVCVSIPSIIIFLIFNNSFEFDRTVKLLKR